MTSYILPCPCLEVRCEKCVCVRVRTWHIKHGNVCVCVSWWKNCILVQFVHIRWAFPVSVSSRTPSVGPCTITHTSTPGFSDAMILSYNTVLSHKCHIISNCVIMFTLSAVLTSGSISCNSKTPSSAILAKEEVWYVSKHFWYVNGRTNN